MRWMWIDQIVAYEPGARLVAVKGVSLAEEHLHDHFPASPRTGAAARPVMPGSLMIEGMAQTAGILVGATRNFSEKVVLAKIAKATFDDDVYPGQMIRYDATLDRIDDAGAATRGTVERFDPRDDAWTTIGGVDLMFSHLDRNMAGVTFPKENFVFSDNFRTLLTNAGIAFEG